MDWLSLEDLDTLNDPVDEVVVAVPPGYEHRDDTCWISVCWSPRNRLRQLIEESRREPVNHDAVTARLRWVDGEETTLARFEEATQVLRRPQRGSWWRVRHAWHSFWAQTFARWAKRSQARVRALE